MNRYVIKLYAIVYGLRHGPLLEPPVYVWAESERQAIKAFKCSPDKEYLVCRRVS